MLEINLYESVNCTRNHRYDKYVRINPVFFILNLKVELMVKYKKNWDVILYKITSTADNITKRGGHFIEFKMDSKLLESIKSIKGEFIINRYVVEWKTNTTGKTAGFFMKKYNAITYLIEDDIVIFDVKQLLFVPEEVVNMSPKAIKRELRLGEIL